MTKAEKRVAVARDVLAQIRAKTIKPSRGNYIAATLSVIPREGDDVQALLRDGKVKSCQSCALGSAFLSYARLYDNVKVEPYGEFSPEMDYPSVGGAIPTKRIHGDRPTDTLELVFDPKQLELIEHAFEAPSRNVSIPDYELTEADIALAKKYGKRYRKDDERLVAIMRNIVRNKGTFKPSAH